MLIVGHACGSSSSSDRCVPLPTPSSIHAVAGAGHYSQLVVELVSVCAYWSAHTVYMSYLTGGRACDTGAAAKYSVGARSHPFLRDAKKAGFGQVRTHHGICPQYGRPGTNTRCYGTHGLTKGGDERHGPGAAGRRMELGGALRPLGMKLLRLRS